MYCLWQKNQDSSNVVGSIIVINGTALLLYYMTMLCYSKWKQLSYIHFDIAI